MKSRPLFVATDTWKSAFPRAGVGVLVMRGAHCRRRLKADPGASGDKGSKFERRCHAQPELSAELEVRKHEPARACRAVAPPPCRLRRASVCRLLPHLRRDMSRFDAVGVGCRQGQGIPCRAALVEAMYMAGLKNLILTAGHDRASIARAGRCDTTGDRYVLPERRRADATRRRHDDGRQQRHHFQRALRARSETPHHT